MTRKFKLLLIAPMVLFAMRNIHAQVSTPFNFGIAANYVGWNAAQGFPLTVAHKGNFPINFQTSSVQRMTIRGQVGPTQGYVGIGTNFLTPTHLLDVRNGDINCGNGLAASPQGYMIGDNYVLRHSGNIQNIFVGVGAGFFNGAGTNDAFVGTAAGLGNTTGSRNSFLGWHAGVVNDGANDNCSGKVKSINVCRCNTFTSAATRKVF